MKDPKNTIYIFGNPLLDEDSLPLRLQSKLQKTLPYINFIIKDPQENLHPDNKQLVVIDTIINCSRITTIQDIEQIDQHTVYSMHDLDAGLNFKILQKLGLLEKIYIIGVPPQGDEKTIFKQITREIIKIMPN